MLWQRLMRVEMRSLGIKHNISLNAHANASITHRLVIYQLNTANSGGPLFVFIHDIHLPSYTRRHAVEARKDNAFAQSSIFMIWRRLLLADCCFRLPYSCGFPLPAGWFSRDRSYGLLVVFCSRCSQVKSRS